MFDRVPAPSNSKSADDRKDINLLPDDLKNREIKARRKSLFSPREPKAVFSSPAKIKASAADIKPILPAAPTGGRLKFSLSKLLSKLKFRRRQPSEPTVVAVSAPVVKPMAKPVSPPPISVNQPHRPPAPARTEPVAPSMPPAKGIDFVPTFQKEEPSLDRQPKFHAVTAPGRLADDSLGINLMPEASKIISPRKALIAYAISVVLAVIILLIPYFMLRFYRGEYAEQNQGLVEQQQLVRSKIAEQKDKIISFGPIAAKMEQLEKLFQNHIYLSRFFPVLEQHTLPRAYFTDLNVSQDLTVALKGRALNLRALAEQLLVFKHSDICHNVSLNQLDLSAKDQSQTTDETVGFSLSFILDKSVISGNMNY